MIKEIQGLRAIAILMVLYVHIEAMGLSNSQQIIFDKSKQLFFTSTGVELFFVIAGFFLMKSLDKYNGENKYQLIFNFLMNKFKRLAPLMIFWAAIALFMSIARFSTELWLEPLIMFKKFLATIVFLRNFEEAYQISWFGIYWAISLEFQVFSIFTICYFILGKRNTIILSLLLCLSMIFYRWGGENSWLFRFDPILWGAILYTIYQKLDIEQLKNTTSSNVIIRSSISIISILVLASNLVIYKSYINFNITISSLVSCVMLLLALSKNNYFYIDLKYIRGLIDWLGSRSYSIFCCHIIIYFIVRTFDFSNIYISQMVSILALIICSELSYRYIESLYQGK